MMPHANAPETAARFPQRVAELLFQAGAWAKVECVRMRVIVLVVATIGELAMCVWYIKTFFRGIWPMQVTI